jgi:hypothetical protein
MREEVKKYLPDILDVFYVEDGRNVVVLNKTPDVFLLQDIIDFHHGKIPPKHVAWIGSSLHNIACYLKFIGYTHNGLTASNYFISPRYHSGLLLGGWWYAKKVGDKLVALPKAAIQVADPDIIKSKIAHPSLDLAMIRQLGLNCLGDPSGINLLHSNDVPKPLINYLRSYHGDDAYKDYHHWQKKVLFPSFGERRFVEMKVEISDIFKD